ncbi:MAG: hypothetical protein ACRDNB_04325, partial [Gaiellaceae bacterium]
LAAVPVELDVPPVKDAAPAVPEVPTIQSTVDDLLPELPVPTPPLPDAVGALPVPALPVETPPLVETVVEVLPTVTVTPPPFLPLEPVTIDTSTLLP